MKSIVQEAPSIMKAIEKGWLAAGKPIYFSVKILEEPQKNFIGLTIRSAKIVLFFDERTQQNKYERRTTRPKSKSSFETPKLIAPEVHNDTQGQRRDKQEMWTQDMIDFVKEWIQGSLNAIDLSYVTFNMQVNRFYLKCSFAQPIHESEEKERYMFRQFVFLLMHTLRNKYKRPLKGFKVILTREN